MRKLKCYCAGCDKIITEKEIVMFKSKCYCKRCWDEIESMRLSNQRGKK